MSDTLVNTLQKLPIAFYSTVFCARFLFASENVFLILGKCLTAIRSITELALFLEQKSLPLDFLFDLLFSHTGSRLIAHGKRFKPLALAVVAVIYPYCVARYFAAYALNYRSRKNRNICLSLTNSQPKNVQNNEIKNKFFLICTFSCK